MPIRPARPCLYAVALIAVLLLTLTACTSEQVAEYKQRIGLLNDKAQQVQEGKAQYLAVVESVIAGIDGELDAARAQAAALEDGPDKDKALAFIDNLIAERERAEAGAKEYVAKADATLTDIAASVDALNTALADVDTPAGAAGATLKETSTYLPPPWNILVGSAGAILLAIENRKKAQAKRSLQSTVEAFETAKREGDGVINFNKAEARNTIRATMSSEAREAVDRARKVMAQKDPNKVLVANAATTN